MQKLEGHIFQRLTPWVQQQLPSTSSETLGNSRCRPRPSSQLRAVEERFRSVHTRLARKIWRDSTTEGRWEDSFRSWQQLGTSYALNRCLREATFPGLWRLWGRAAPTIPDEQDLLNLRPMLDRLVVTHVDKLPTEGMIL